MQIKEKRSNAGFSLVELLVVVAIMGVLMGGAVMSWYTISSNNVKKAGSYIDDALTECKSRAKTQAAHSWTVELTNDSVQVHKYISDDTGSVTDEIILSEKLPANVDVYVLTDHSEKFDLASGVDMVQFEYKILTGEISSIYVEDGGTSWPAYNNNSLYSDYKYCDIVCKHEKREYKMRLYFTTGKHIEQ